MSVPVRSSSTSPSTGDENKPNARGGLGAIAGDAVYAEVEPIVEAITPVPGGVGSVTTSVLMKHVIEAAERV